MHSPLFVETSAGQVNLALVTHIYERAGEVMFQFERSMVALPKDEGKKLLAILRPIFSDRFNDWMMGVK
jgi:hypothetical protein